MRASCRRRVLFVMRCNIDRLAATSSGYSVFCICPLLSAGIVFGAVEYRSVGGDLFGSIFLCVFSLLSPGVVICAVQCYRSVSSDLS